MDAIRLVEELVGKKAKIEYRPRHPADVQDGCFARNRRSMTSMQ